MSQQDSQTPRRPVNVDLQLRLIMLAMAGALVLIGAVLVLIGAQAVTPETWMLAVVGVATVAAWALVLAVPVPAAARRQPVPMVTMTMTVFRLAVLEAPAFLGLALAFVSVPMNLLVYVLPALASLAGMALFARPAVVRARVERASSPGQPRP